MIDKLIEKLSTFSEAIDGALPDIIRENEPFILDMNIEDQLYERGQTRLGVSIASFAPYAPSTIQYKKANRQPYDRVTLRDTEDFHKSFYLDIDSEKFEIKAKDWKADKLRSRYGDDIFGLSLDNLKGVKEFIYTDLCTLRDNILKDYAGN